MSALSRLSSGLSLFSLYRSSLPTSLSPPKSALSLLSSVVSPSSHSHTHTFAFSFSVSLALFLARGAVPPFVRSLSLSLYLSLSLSFSLLSLSLSLSRRCAFFREVSRSSHTLSPFLSFRSLSLARARSCALFRERSLALPHAGPNNNEKCCDCFSAVCCVRCRHLTNAATASLQSMSCGFWREKRRPLVFFLLINSSHFSLDLKLFDHMSLEISFLQDFFSQCTSQSRSRSRSSLLPSLPPSLPPCLSL